MYIDTVPNRNSPPCFLLRESYRVGKQVKKRTLANLTDWPPQLLENFRVLLKGGSAVESIEDCFSINRTLPHGHVAAVLGTLRKIGLETVLHSRRSLERDRVVAMIVARVIRPGSKLSLVRHLHQETRSSSLGELLNLNSVSENDLYSAMDWLLDRQQAIEKNLARKHLQEGVLVLYDLTSTYFEGTKCPLAHYGYSRDGKKNTLQIVFGLLCTREGFPITVEVFKGNTLDHQTLSSQISKVRERFGLQHVVFVGDRGMITQARIREEMQDVEGLDWITALTASQVKRLLKDDSLQPSLLDEEDLAEIQSPDYPGERLVVCRNPLLADERTRTRNELLQATENELDRIVAAVNRSTRPLRGKDQIGIRVGKVLGRFKMEKHIHITITEMEFHYERKTESIRIEQSLDGIYIVRSSLPNPPFTAEELVESYKGLSVVERAFRCMKTVDLHVRPIYHRLSDRVRAHVFLCMLAYYVEWHMRKALAPILFEDAEPEVGKAARKSVVMPAQRSPKALWKAQSKRTEDGEPVHSFQTLLDDLSTIAKQRCQPRDSSLPSFEKSTIPTPLQQRAFDLLQLRL